MEVFFQALMLASGLAQALIYGLGGYLALRGDLEPGTVVTLALLLSRLYAPLTALATARLDGGDRARELRAGVRGARHRALGARGDRAPRPCPTARSPSSSTEWRFRYPSADQVSLASLEEVAVLDDRGRTSTCLHGIDLQVPAGHTVALVGRSGAGKSTIASLVSRLYDVTDGSVRLGGVDVRDLTFASIRGTVGVVTQDGHLFHESLGANLRYAKPDATDDELWAALRSARLDRLVASLPDGLDTVVGERGYRLSGGERQRLTIARLLLAQPRVVNPRRGHRPPRFGVGGRGAVSARRRARRPYGAGDRAPALDHPRRRRDRRHRPRPCGRSRAPTPNCSRRTAFYAELHRTQFADGARDVDRNAVA